jgi:flagellar protein FliO/FliZ
MRTLEHHSLQRVATATAVLAAVLAGEVLAENRPQEISPVGLAGQAMGADFLLQFTVGLVLVLFSVVALAWLMRRFGRLQSSANGSLEVIGGLALGARERVVLVQVGETQVLVGVAPGRVEAVHVLSEPVRVRKPQEAQPGSFAARLKDVLKAEKQA